MSQKIISLREEEIRAIGDAFADFEYAESEFGMAYLGKNRQAVSDYICAYVRMTIREHGWMRSIRETEQSFMRPVSFTISKKRMWRLSSHLKMLRNLKGGVMTLLQSLQRVI